MIVHPDDLPTPPAARRKASYITREGAAYWLEPGARRLQVVAPPDHHVLRRLEGTHRHADEHIFLQAELSPKNAAALRDALPWLSPRPLGLAPSVGFGDRLGVATPGHVLATQRHGRGLTPIFAQQSIREMTRTRRTPQVVMDDATWGAFEAGWRGPLGADADHQKTTRDLDRCAEAGFTLFTVDPGEFVDDAAHDAAAGDLEALRVVSQEKPDLFRDLLALGRERFADDRASYHISAELARVPEVDELHDDALPKLLDQDDARQVLHVTFGSALDRFREPLLELLKNHEAAHYAALEQNFRKHLTPFEEVAR